jgi:hypothetical protein
MGSRGIAIATAAVVLGIVGGTGFAQASSGGAPSHITIATAGVGSFKPNRFFKETVRFTKRSYTVATGGTITFEKGPKDMTPDPHTLTVVSPAQVPKTALEVELCLGGAPGTGCAIGDAARMPVVEPGKPGLNRPGDTYGLFPSKQGKYAPLTIKVTAPAGTTLHFICSVHPWMQAVLHVTN